MRRFLPRVFCGTQTDRGIEDQAKQWSGDKGWYNIVLQQPLGLGGLWRSCQGMDLPLYLHLLHQAISP